MHYISAKEINGIKPLKPRISVNKFEHLVCEMFKLKKGDLRKRAYNNIARMAMVYLAFDYCGLTLKDIGQRYGEISETAVNKVVSRFRFRLSKDKKLNNKIKMIVSNGEM